MTPDELVARAQEARIRRQMALLRRLAPTWEGALAFVFVALAFVFVALFLVVAGVYAR